MRKSKQVYHNERNVLKISFDRCEKWVFDRVECKTEFYNLWDKLIFVMMIWWCRRQLFDFVCWNYFPINYFILFCPFIDWVTWGEKKCTFESNRIDNCNIESVVHCWELHSCDDMAKNSFSFQIKNKNWFCNCGMYFCQYIVSTAYILNDLNWLRNTCK